MDNFQQNGDSKCGGLRYADWCNLSSSLIWAYEGHPLGARGTFHTWKLSAWLLTRGRLKIQGAGAAVDVSAGAWVFPPFKQDVREFSQDATVLSISFLLRWPNARSLFELPNALTFEAQRFPNLERSARRILSQVGRSKGESAVDLGSRDMGLQDFSQLEQHFQRWVVCYIEAMLALGVDPVLVHGGDERMLGARAYLDRLPLSEPLILQDAAAKVGLSLSQADRLYVKEYGHSMRRHFDERRFAAAIHQLAATEQPVKAIAFSLGFKDSSSFSHWFFKKQGTYPRAFRARVSGVED